MRYLILILMFITVACAKNTPATEDIQQKCLSCDNAPEATAAELEEVMIEIQNNAEECAVRIWSRISDKPLYEVKGGYGIHNCKIYIIQNPEIKSKENE